MEILTTQRAILDHLRTTSVAPLPLALPTLKPAVLALTHMQHSTDTQRIGMVAAAPDVTDTSAASPPPLPAATVDALTQHVGVKRSADTVAAVSSRTRKCFLPAPPNEITITTNLGAVDIADLYHDALRVNTVVQHQNRQDRQRLNAVVLHAIVEGHSGRAHGAAAQAAGGASGGKIFSSVGAVE